MFVLQCQLPFRLSPGPNLHPPSIEWLRRATRLKQQEQKSITSGRLPMNIGADTRTQNDREQKKVEKNSMHLKLKLEVDAFGIVEAEKGNNMIAEALGAIAKQIGAVATSSPNLASELLGSQISWVLASLQHDYETGLRASAHFSFLHVPTTLSSVGAASHGTPTAYFRV